MSRLSRLGSNLTVLSLIGNRDDEVLSPGGSPTPALSVTITDSPDPLTLPGSVSLTISVVVTENQTSIDMNVFVQSGFDGGKPLSVTDVDLDGWTRSDGWTFGGTETNPNYSAVFSKATITAGTYNLLFTVDVAGPGTVNFSASVSSDQVTEEATDTETTTLV